MIEIKVKRTRNMGDYGEYPALRNVDTGKVYVDICLGLADRITPDSDGLNRFGDYVGYNIRGHWHTYEGEPECALRRDIKFILED